MLEIMLEINDVGNVGNNVGNDVGNNVGNVGKQMDMLEMRYVDKNVGEAFQR